MRDARMMCHGQSGRQTECRSGWSGFAALLIGVAAVLGTVTASSAAVTLQSLEGTNVVTWNSSARDKMTAQAEAVTATITSKWIKLSGDTRAKRVSLLPRDTYRLWSEELDEEIIADAEGFVEKVEARPSGIYVAVEVAEVLRGLVSVLFGDITPRVAVLTKEEVIQRRPPDPAVKTALTSALLDYGFRVVSPEDYSRWLERETSFQAADDDQELYRLVGSELSADILVVGDSFAEQDMDRRGFTARCEYCVVEAATGRVIGAVARTFPVRDARSELAAAKLALQRGAEESVLQVCAQMLGEYGKPITQVRVMRSRGVTEAMAIARSLSEKLGGCDVVPQEMHSKGSQSFTFSVSTKASPMEVAAALEAVDMGDSRIRATTVSCRNIVCEVM